MMPEGWREEKLINVCKPKQWPTVSKEAMKPGPYPVFGANGWIGHHDEFTHEEDTIAITCRGASCGNVNLVPGKVYITGNSMALDSVRPDIILQKFLYFTLIQRGLKDTITGSAQPQITREKLGPVAFLLPPLPEQRAIAEILDSVDTTISATEATLAQTRRVKQALLQQLLTKGIAENGRPHTKFKVTEIGEIPEGWGLSSVGTLADEVTVGIACSATHAYVPSGKGVAMIRNQNIKDGWIDETEMLNISKDFDNEFASKRLRAGDLVIARTGYPGLTAVVPKKLDACQTFTTLIVRLPQTVSPDYCAIWMNSPAGARIVSKLQAGGAQQNLNAGALKTMPIPIPPYTEQARIVSSLFGMRNYQLSLEKTVRELAELKRALMRDLLTGRVRVKDVKL